MKSPPALGSCAFVELPVELRYQIYGYLIHKHRYYKLKIHTQDNGNHCDPLSLMQVNKQVKNEIIDWYPIYNTVGFISLRSFVGFMLCEPSPITRRLRKIVLHIDASEFALAITSSSDSGQGKSDLVTMTCPGLFRNITEHPDAFHRHFKRCGPAYQEFSRRVAQLQLGFLLIEVDFDEPMCPDHWRAFAQDCGESLPNLIQYLSVGIAQEADFTVDIVGPGPTIFHFVQECNSPASVDSRQTWSTCTIFESSDDELSDESEDIDLDDSDYDVDAEKDGKPEDEGDSGDDGIATQKFNGPGGGACSVQSYVDTAWKATTGMFPDDDDTDFEEIEAYEDEDNRPKTKYGVLL